MIETLHRQEIIVTRTLLALVSAGAILEREILPTNDPRKRQNKPLS